MNREEYDASVFSTPKSRMHLQIAAAYVNVAMRAAPTKDELIACISGPINTTRARAFAVMTNLSFAFEVALKGQLDNELLERLNIGGVDRRQGHDLRYLFNKLSRAEQEQLIWSVKNVLVIDDELFNHLFDQCKNGFVEWRYFFEEKSPGKTYDYGRLVPFMYASLYYLLSSEGKDDLLEHCALKKRCFVGNSGLILQRSQKKKEYNEAVRISLEDGHGNISPDDAQWIQGIKAQIDDFNERIRELEEQYDSNL